MIGTVAMIRFRLAVRTGQCTVRWMLSEVLAWLARRRVTEKDPSQSEADLWYGTDVAFIQKIVDFANDWRSTLKEKFLTLMAYAMAGPRDRQGQYRAHRLPAIGHAASIFICVRYRIGYPVIDGALAPAAPGLADPYLVWKVPS
jgi:hypothetical protein